VSVGVDSACAVTSAGGVECWGNNQLGQLGDGTTDASAVPVPVQGLAGGVTAVAVGADSACAVTAGGGVSCWGQDPAGELGSAVATTCTLGYQQVTKSTCVGLGDVWQDDAGCLGKVACSTTPVSVAGLNGVKGIALGVSQLGDSYVCVVTSTGGVSCWGPGLFGGNTNWAPTAIPGFASATAVSVAYGSICIVTTGGGAECQGKDPGNGLDDSATPVGVAGLSSGVTEISVGWDSLCATGAGGVACWGDNTWYEVGTTTVASANEPIPVAGL
jgi:hypothetical protein